MTRNTSAVADSRSLDAGNPLAGGVRVASRRLGVPHPSRRRLAIVSLQVLIIAAALLSWQAVGGSSGAESQTVSTPLATWDWLVGWVGGSLAPHGLNDLGLTLEAAALGWGLGVAVGIALAVFLASSRWLRMYGAPFVAVLNALPKIALAPLFVLIFGLALRSQVYFVASSIFFIVFYNVSSGLRSISNLHLDYARSLGASRRFLITDVYLPSILGWVMTGLRLTAAWALTSAVVAEYLGADQGIGYVVAYGEAGLNASEVMGGILAISIVAVIVDRMLIRIERHFAQWRLG